MGGQEDDGEIDEEDDGVIDEAWRKARRMKLVGEAREKEYDQGARSGSSWGERDRREEKSEELCSREPSYVCDLPLRLIGS
jgi:hypothetical protein